MVTQADASATFFAFLSEWNVWPAVHTTTYSIGFSVITSMMYRSFPFFTSLVTYKISFYWVETRIPYMFVLCDVHCKFSITKANILRTFIVFRRTFNVYSLSIFFNNGIFIISVFRFTLFFLAAILALKRYILL